MHYLLDEAEIPTVRNKRLGRGELVRAKTQAIVSGLELTVDGRRVALEAARPGELAFTAGQAGLDTTRLELALRASVTDPRRVELRDRHLRGARRAPLDRGRARRGHRRAHEHADGRSHTRAHALPEGRAGEPAQPHRVELQRARRATGPWWRPGRRAASSRASATRAGAASPTSSRTPPTAGECWCSCCWPRSAGEPCTRSRPVTARRWWPPTWRARGARRSTPWRSGWWSP